MSTGLKSVNAAVIGYGGAFNMGKGHADWMAQAGIATVAACDLDVKRLEAARRDFPDIHTYTDYKELLKDKSVDLCVVILPHNQHADVAVACANAGKHVVVEKPMCIKVSEADAMIDAANRNGVMLSVFHNRRWDGDFMTIRDSIAEGLIGDVFQIEASIGGFSPPGKWWRSDKAVAGGVLHDWGAHFLDWILNLVKSNVSDVSGFFLTDVWKGGTVEDHGHAVMRFENGCMADLQVSSLNSVPKPKWRILGTKGGIVSDWEGDITIKTEVKGHLATLEVPCKPTEWGRYYENIAAHLKDGAPLAVKAEESRRTIAIIEAAEQSSNSGHSVKPAYG